MVHRHPQKAKQPKARFFSETTEALADGALLACSASTPEARKSGKHHGLLHDHAYAILDVRSIEDADGAVHSLIRLRNPWGQYEWSGAWSDGDTSHWTAELTRALGQVARNDGCFWMNLDDFWRFFDALHVCRTLGDEPDWSTLTLEGAWNSATAGGDNTNSSFKTNPVYALWLPPGGPPTSGEVAATTTLYATLSIDTHVPSRMAASSYREIGIILGGLSMPSLHRGLGSFTSVQAPLIQSERDVTLEASCPPQPAGASTPIMIVPFTKEPAALGRYRLTLHTRQPLAAVREVTSTDGSALLDAWLSGTTNAVAHGAWFKKGSGSSGGPPTPSTAGGPMADDIERWCTNPQLGFELAQPMRVLVGVAVPSAEAGIGAYGQKPRGKGDAGGPKPLRVGLDIAVGGKGAKLADLRVEMAEAPWDELCDGIAPFVAGSVCWFEYKKLPKGHFVIVPHTGKAGEIGDFTVTVVALPLADSSKGKKCAGDTAASAASVDCLDLRLRLLEPPEPKAPPAAAASGKKKKPKKAS